MSNQIHNERVKYAATFFNNLGVAAFAGGTIIPLFSPTLFLPNGGKGFVWVVSLSVGVILGTFFLFSAYRLLGSLKE
jgi:hypothetical protein